MRIATWNVNSIRARSETVVAWMERHDIDVLAMQETKCPDDQFPVMSFLASGYDVVFCGQGGFNGVAIASRVGLESVQYGFDGQPAFADVGVEARAVAAVCDGVQVWSLYVPNGRSLTDPHYAYKLEWLSALADRSALWLAHDPAAQIVLAGDWNVAPTDDDVWDRTYFEGRPHVTEAERAALAAFTGHGFTDAALPYAPGYTCWDYTQLRFPRDEGVRIDYLLCSPALGDRVFDAHVDRNARKARGASDHAPVVLEIS
ncbi:exodeoxyribonuclease III [Gordonia sp. (in: high G+C Gram-positive bacteria)]|jgi:exodeoxyribonuclease-3|uniref:exodeoxyribonuclease III n=1 Tax=Gordonia sp. (in: high G+C Gram-positive bacteria) TaxID=84139 RepID=UPI001DECAF00|nr:exodeoxyribonuclease III [Gordonia sp. (in: high G+C Gram-positive bacteria)]MCB1295627.1 exodeoxyribonuclease III [Gordonia sp. (in: high G+C Gram-positive bacteria)]HMS74824.1 exodeoxyribonuclease III [Gordonia sp. (in: high G+C Gram-positive bacteria)]HQV19020.1 exodeoxyribonuclease III [Gordonia sp. (in: high G+C Gram-positive bacteria)]